MTSQLRLPSRNSSYRRVSGCQTSISENAFEFSPNIVGGPSYRSDIFLCKDVIVNTEEVNSGEHNHRQHDLWSPLILKRRSLWSFITVFVSLTIAIIALWIASDRADGLLAVESGRYYFWTYGPTAGEKIPE